MAPPRSRRGDGVVAVDPVRGPDGASGHYAGGGAGRIAGRLGVAGASCRDGAGFTPARCVCRIRSGGEYWRGTIPHEEKLFSLFEPPHTRWIMKGKASEPVEAGDSPNGAGRSVSVHPELVLGVAWLRRGSSAGGGVPGAVSMAFV